jgi:hypothetical protein
MPRARKAKPNAPRKPPRSRKQPIERGPDVPPWLPAGTCWEKLRVINQSLERGKPLSAPLTPVPSPASGRGEERPESPLSPWERVRVRAGDVKRCGERRPTRSPLTRSPSPEKRATGDSGPPPARPVLGSPALDISSSRPAPGFTPLNPDFGELGRADPRTLNPPPVPPKLEKSKPADQLPHPALEWIAARPELFSRQGYVTATFRRRNGKTFGPYYLLNYRSKKTTCRLPCQPAFVMLKDDCTRSSLCPWRMHRSRRGPARRNSRRH